MRALLQRKTCARCSLVFIVVLTVATPNSYSGQNVWTGHGPEGGTIELLAVHPQRPDIIYAAGTDMLFKTTDQGNQWTPIANGSSDSRRSQWTPTLNDSIASLAVDPLDPNTVYFGTNQGAIVKSANGGTDWTC